MLVPVVDMKLTGNITLIGGRCGLKAEGTAELNGNITLNGSSIGLSAGRKLTISGGKVTVPKLAYMTLADAEELLKQTGLRMGSTLNIVDTRNAKEHGKVSSQSPAENTDAMLDDIVSVNVFRYLTDASSKEITIQLKEESKDINVRVTLKAEGSDVEYEVYQHLYPADLERQQTIMLNLPDERTYTCTVYQDDEPQEPFVIER